MPARTLAVLLSSLLFASAQVAQPADDEQQLREIQQSLTRAWLQRDRAFIESVLAPEWSVTQADGQVLTRATVLGPFFDGLKLDTSVIDDVSVLLLGTTAVVRGRTVASGTLQGAQVSARIRFTDVFIKRDGRWQAVASHASPLMAVGGGADAVAPSETVHPLVGDWTANISRSTLAPNYQLQSATVQFAVAGDIVTATSRVVLASGQQSQVTERFQTDGKGHPFERSPLGPGVVVVARWLGPRVLETIATQNGTEAARATYEVSADGKTLIATTSGMVQQVIVFERK